MIDNDQFAVDYNGAINFTKKIIEIRSKKYRNLVVFFGFLSFFIFLAFLVFGFWYFFAYFLLFFLSHAFFIFFDQRIIQTWKNQVNRQGRQLHVLLTRRLIDASGIISVLDLSSARNGCVQDM